MLLDDKRGCISVFHMENSVYVCETVPATCILKRRCIFRCMSDKISK